MSTEKETQQHCLDLEFYFLLGYLVFGLVSSLIGDTFILAATKTRGAFKLNKHLIVVIQHIAVSDLATCLFWILPVTLNMISIVRRNEWVFKNEKLAYIRYGLAYYMYITNTYLVVVLTATKLTILKIPLRVNRWSKNMAHWACAGIWSVCLWVPIAISVVYGDRPNLVKDREILDVKPGKINPILTNVYMALGVFLPICLMIFTTIPAFLFLLNARKVSRQSGGKTRWHGLLTVILTASLYCVSYSPHLLTPFAIKLGTKKRLTWYCSLLNIMSNFYIYSFTVPSFRKFLLLKLRLPRSRLSGSERVTVEMTNQTSLNKKPLSSRLSQF